MPPQVQLSAVLCEHGVSFESDISVFWKLVSSHMVTERDKAVCTDICNELKSEYLAVFVESMLGLSHEQMLHTITRCGGRAEWVPRIEGLLGRRFRRAHTNAPPSADLVFDTAAPSDIDSSSVNVLLGQNESHTTPVLAQQPEGTVDQPVRRLEMSFAATDDSTSDGPPMASAVEGSVTSPVANPVANPVVGPVVGPARSTFMDT